MKLSYKLMEISSLFSMMKVNDSNGKNNTRFAIK